MKRAVVIPNISKDNGLVLTGKIVDTLTSVGIHVSLSQQFSDSSIKAEYLPDTALFDSSDFVVTVGGDGTILGIAGEASKRGLSIVGVNLGRMGFMAELEPDEIHLLKNICTSDYSLEKRMMLDVRVVSAGKVTASYTALNDIVVSKGSISKIAELELYCNGTLVSQFHSDGVIISTPTGSTAYSLSAGGAIIDPLIDCMLFTPVCPHSFNNSRPTVFSPNTVLAVKDIQKGEENTYLTVDGRINQQLAFSDVVEARASSQTVNLIKLKNTEFYDKVYQKIAERK